MDDQREQARELRREGLSLSQIKAKLGIRSNKVLDKWLTGIPAPEWTRRPRAKDDLRAEAVRLRIDEGLTYDEILEEVPVSKSSLSLWLRDYPHPVDEERRRTARARAAASWHQKRLDRTAAIKADAAAEIGELTDRELFLLGVVAYWAEGAKEKPWGHAASVQFINSDPTMVDLFLRWCALLGVTSDRLTFRIAIHESADVAGATTYWAEMVGVPASQFRRPTLKRHNPKTPRRNIGEEYHGCLSVRVSSSGDLNRRIAGWWAGISAALEQRVTTGSLGLTIAGGAIRKHGSLWSCSDPGSSPGPRAEPATRGDASE